MVEAAGTIGNASSGATRANADCYELFVLLWALNATDYPILTSAGGASTRGANADADWNANKRLTIKDMRAEFFRGLDNGRSVDTGRVLGSAQAEMVGPHTHPISTDAMGSNPGSGVRPTAQTTGATPTALANSGTENRPRNIALLVCLKL